MADNVLAGSFSTAISENIIVDDRRVKENRVQRSCIKALNYNITVLDSSSLFPVKMSGNRPFIKLHAETGVCIILNSNTKDMPEEKPNKIDKTVTESAEKLQTEGPISERDEVKEAEERTRELQKGANQSDEDKK